MNSQEQVVTELTIDSSGAERGEAAFTAAMSRAEAAANDNLKLIAANTRAMNDNLELFGRNTRTAMDSSSRSLSESGLHWAEVTNHLRQAGEAAYLLSPRFRELVNSMAGPATRAATVAIEGAALAVVRGTNLAGQALVELGVAAARSSTALAPFAGQIALTGAAMAGWSPTITGVAASILGRFLPAVAAVARVVAPILLIKNAIDLVTEAWTLGGQKLDEYRAIAEKAAAVDLSTSYFQRITKSAGDAKTDVDELTAALKRFSQANTEQLGGSELEQRLDKHLKAGNFKGNSGVAGFEAANTTEEQFRAIVKLIDEAMQKGQRLAALDLAQTAFGSEITTRLREDSDYLNRIVASADKISATQLVSDADVSRALDLQRRYDAAVAILSQRWHPIQDLLASLGVRMQEIWVGIVEAIAKAADAVVKLGQAIVDKIPAGFWTLIQRGASIVASVLPTVAGAAFGPVGAGIGAATSIASGVLGSDGAASSDARAAAVNKLADGLKNTNAVTAAASQTNAVYNAVLRDGSRTLDDVKKAHQDVDDAVDRMINSMRRHVEVQAADAKAVGLGVEAQARLRAEAQLTAAVQANGGKITAEQSSEFAKLRDRAGEVALALAKARVAFDIRFNRDTSFLSQEDVSIAQQLKQIYPDVAQALGSVEAEGIRLNSAMRGLSSSIESSLVSSLTDITTGAVSAGQGFDNMSKAIIRAIEEMIIKMTIIQPLMRSLQLGFSSLGLGSFFGGGPVSLGNLGGTAGILSPIHHSGGIVGDGTEMRFIHPAYFDNAPRYHSGGIAGLAPDEVPAILQRGERITPRGQSAGGGVSLNVNVINQTGVPAKTETSQDANGDMTITLKKMVEQIGVESIASGDMGRAITTKYGVKQFAGQ